MRGRLVAFLLLLSACQPVQWQGTWKGSVTLNDGRQPRTAMGTLTVATGSGIPAGLLFGFSGTLPGSPNTFACPPVVPTAMNTATTASLLTGATCRLTATPDDGCTHELTFTSGALTLSGDQLTGTGNGRLSSACTGMGSTVSDFGWTLTASDRR
jgi:hypothetical protein